CCMRSCSDRYRVSMLQQLVTLQSDPLLSRRISPLDWQQSKTYYRFVRYGERILRRSSRNFAPWYVIEGADERYRSLIAGRLLLDGLNAALAAQRGPTVARHSAPVEADMSLNRSRS